MTAIQGMMYSVLFISSDTEPSDWPSDKIEISLGNSRIFVLSVKLVPCSIHPIFHTNCVLIVTFFLKIARAHFDIQMISTYLNF